MPQPSFEDLLQEAAKFHGGGAPPTAPPAAAPAPLPESVLTKRDPTRTLGFRTLTKESTFEQATTPRERREILQNYLTSPPGAQRGMLEADAEMTEWLKKQEGFVEPPAAPAAPAPGAAPGATPQPTPQVTPQPGPQPTPGPLEEQVPIGALPGEAAEALAERFGPSIKQFLPSEMKAKLLIEQERRRQAGERMGAADIAERMAADVLALGEGAVRAVPESMAELARPVGERLGRAVGGEVVPGVPGTGERPPGPPTEVPLEATEKVVGGLVDPLLRYPLQLGYDQPRTPAEVAAEAPVSGPLIPALAAAGVAGARARVLTPAERNIAAVEQARPPGPGALAPRGAEGIAPREGVAVPRGELAPAGAPSFLQRRGAVFAEGGNVVKELPPPDMLGAMERVVARKVSDPWGEGLRGIGRKALELGEKDSPRFTRAFKAVFLDEGNKSPEMVELFDVFHAARALRHEDARGLVDGLRDAVRQEMRGEVGPLQFIKKRQLYESTLRDLFDLRVGEGQSVPALSLARRVFEKNPGIYEYLDKLGAELSEVAPDILSPQTVAEHAGSYLPYYYAEGAIEALRASARGELSTAIIKEGFKGREAQVPGLGQSRRAMARTKRRRQDLTYQDRIDRGLVRDPVYAMARGVMELGDLIQTRRLQNTIAQRSDVLVTQVHRRQIATLEGQIVEATKQGNESRVAELNKQLEQARGELKNLRFLAEETGGMIKLPEGGAAERAYGPLAGAHVPTEMAMDLREIMGRGMDYELLGTTRQSLLGAHQTLMSAFKVGKVAISPGTMTANWMGNHFQAYLAGMPFHRQPQYLARTFKDLLTGDRKMLREAIEAGAVDAGFFDAEGLRTVQMMQQAVGHSESGAAHTGVGKTAMGAASFAASLAKRGAVKGWNGVQRAYNGVDSVWKVAHYHYAREVLGMEPRAAAQRAKEAHFDYSKAPEWVKLNSQYWHPFAMFTWKYSKFMAQKAVEHPLKVANLMGGIYAMDSAGHALSEEKDLGWGFSEEARGERRKERAGLTTAESLLAVRMPFKGERDNPIDFRLGRALPALMSNEASDVTLPASVLQMLPFANPLVMETVEQAANIDLFTGQPIRQPGSSPSQQAWESTKHILGTLAPTLAGDAVLLNDVANGKSFYGTPRPMWEMLLYRWGLMRPLTPFSGEGGRGLAFAREMRQMQRAMMRDLRPWAGNQLELKRRSVLWKERAKRIVEKHRKHLE